MRPAACGRNASQPKAQEKTPVPQPEISFLRALWSRLFGGRYFCRGLLFRRCGWRSQTCRQVFLLQFVYAAIALLLAPIASAQTSPMIRVPVRVVDVPAAVVDGTGKPVRGLTGGE